MAIAKKAKRTIAYVGIIGGCAVLALTLFSISQYERAKYKAAGLVQTMAKNRLDKALTLDPTALENEASKYHAHAVYYAEIYNDFTGKVNATSAAYVGTAIPAYTFSMATLVAFGLILKHAEKTKEKEEKEV